MSGPPPEVPSPPNSAFPPHSSLPPYLTPWSDNPNAPRVSHDTYFMEKANFAGSLIGSILYGTHITPPLPRPVLTLFIRSIQGIIVVLFVQCMAALFNPVHRGKEGIKWGFVSYTVTIFLTVTVVTTTNLNTQSISFIDHRELPNFFPGILSGPMGYLWVLHQGPFGVVTNLAFLLNYLLADGLLVSSLFGSAFTRPIPTPAPPPALPLLRNLPQKSLGNYLPLPHVPWRFGCAFVSLKPVVTF